MRFLHTKRKKVCVALSGGVDSSVAAYLLKKQGHEVIGAFIRGYNVDGCQDREADDAQRVAAQLSIPFYSFDFEKEYENRVVHYLLDGYKKGITPNPDVVCNSEIKFGLLYDAVMKMGFDFVASGHYAKIRRPWTRGTSSLYIAKDTNKDQTYFLYKVERERFSHIMFPLGSLTKPRVRDIAKGIGLLTAEKKDSQGICFLGKFDFSEFLKNAIGVTPGIVRDIHGVQVGTHYGVSVYTIGQRHGFINTAGKQAYVVRKDIDHNELVVAYDGDESLFTDTISCGMCNYLDLPFWERLDSGKQCSALVRTRYRQPLRRAILTKTKDDSVSIMFPKKEKLFPAVGQSAVWYTSSGKVLGGGIIQ